MAQGKAKPACMGWWVPRGQPRGQTLGRDSSGALLLPSLSFLICKMGTMTLVPHLLASPGEQGSNDSTHESPGIRAGRRVGTFAPSSTACADVPSRCPSVVGLCVTQAGGSSTFSTVPAFTDPHQGASGAVGHSRRQGDLGGPGREEQE